MTNSVLIAGDSAITCGVVSKAVHTSKLAVGDMREAKDGVEALAVLGQAWSDIALADINSKGARACAVKAFRPEHFRESCDGAAPTTERMGPMSTSARYRDIVFNVPRKVLEQGAFVLTELTREEPTWTGPPVHAALPFSGDVDRHLTLTASPGLDAPLAADVLGVEPGRGGLADRRGYAVGGVLNVMTGLLSEQWFGSSGGWEVGVPTAGTISTEALCEYRRKADAAVGVRTEGGHPEDLAGLFGKRGYR
jgi:hypothetical protein